MEAKKLYNWVALDKPERYGYKKFYVIREDVKKGFPNMLPVYTDILKMCNLEIHSRDKKFLVKDWKTGKKVQAQLQLKYIMPRQWEQLPSDKHREQFIMTLERDYRNKQYQAYRVRDPWMFVEQMKPYYITHRLVIDPKLDRELREIENKITTNGLMPALGKALGWDERGYRGGTTPTDLYIKALNLDLRKYLQEGE